MHTMELPYDRKREQDREATWSHLEELPLMVIASHPRAKWSRGGLGEGQTDLTVVSTLTDCLSEILGAGSRAGDGASQASAERKTRGECPLERQGGGEGTAETVRQTTSLSC